MRAARIIRNAPTARCDGCGLGVENRRRSRLSLYDSDGELAYWCDLRCFAQSIVTETDLLDFPIQWLRNIAEGAD